MPARIELKNLVKNYGQTEVIRGVDMAIAAGEFTVFVGPSGCGKSTLLRMIAGLDPITGGDLLIDGQRMNDVPAAQRGISMVFQSYALYPHMSVYRNLAFGLETAKVPKAQIADRVSRVADILRIGSLLERRPKQLSGGQRQRVAIGRAMIRDAKIILFDEPLSNLDAELRVQMRVEISKLHSQLGNNMIYVTHDQVEAMTMADRIVVLSDGKIEQIGSPLELYNKPKNVFVAGFIGSPKMNLFDVVVEETGDTSTVLSLAGERVALRRPSRAKKGDKVTFGVRPEHLSIKPEGEVSIAAAKVHVDLVEHLGGQTVLYTHLPDSTAVNVVLSGQAAVSQGECLPIFADVEKCHLFDESGRSIW